MMRIVIQTDKPAYNLQPATYNSLQQRFRFLNYIINGKAEVFV